MKEYICSVCGYVHKTDGELPDDFKMRLFEIAFRPVGSVLFQFERVLA